MSTRRCALVLSLAAALLAPGAKAGGRVPGVPDAIRPHYAHTSDGFKHFVADNLEPLVEGEAFTSEGRRYEVVKLHSIVKHELTRWVPSHRDAVVPLRGRVIAVVHVKVDGQLMRARIEGNADYVPQPDGWRWSQVLMYLGRNESYDFVRGETD